MAAPVAAGPFKVTIAARNIVELMTTIMQEAQATGSSAVVQSMSNCLAEIASLFVAVPESRLRQQILQVCHHRNDATLCPLCRCLLYCLLPCLCMYHHHQP